MSGAGFDPAGMTGHGAAQGPAGVQAAPGLPGAPGGVPGGWPSRAIAWLNRGALLAGMLALLASALVLTSSVLTRYFFHATTDWQDEIAVFCLTGATFLCGAWVQSQRGHIGIEAIAGYLPRSVERARLFLVDLVTFLFCAFFAWKSWTLWHEAWEGGMRTSSTFGAPLSIPYGLMAAGMTMLAVQVALQLATRRVPPRIGGSK